MLKLPPNNILVVFGASGDLTKRKLIPALYELDKEGLLPKNMMVLGVGRTQMDDRDFRNFQKQELINLKVAEKNELLDIFINRLYYQPLDTGNLSAYSNLKGRIENLSENLQEKSNLIFYLATPPSLYKIITEGLALIGLNSPIKNGEFVRIIIEKPFGSSLSTAKDLNKHVLRYFAEEQIYRIDHYLGKETVQNLMVFRFANGIFEPLWNRNYIHHIEITSAENIGVENRGGYYDGIGALRDMVQNHLLQVLAIVAMEPPIVNSPTAIRNETLKVLQAIRRYKDDEIINNVIRGQYVQSKIRGEQVKAYREEKGVPSDTKTETFVAMKLTIDNWRWGGVPFYIRTGKHLPTKVTEIVIRFKPTPHKLFCKNDLSSVSDNYLVIRIQPDEGVLLNTGMKVPGRGFVVQDVGLDFHYSSLNDTKLPEAYQRLLLDCMSGDNTLFARGDAVEEAWKIVDPILDVWNQAPNSPLYGYPAGTWGPEQANNLIDSKNLTWRMPCKNLTSDSSFCEL